MNEDDRENASAQGGMPPAEPGAGSEGREPAGDDSVAGADDGAAAAKSPRRRGRRGGRRHKSAAQRAADAAAAAESGAPPQALPRDQRVDARSASVGESVSPAAGGTAGPKPAPAGDDKSEPTEPPAAKGDAPAVSKSRRRRRPKAAAAPELPSSGDMRGAKLLADEAPSLPVTAGSAPAGDDLTVTDAAGKAATPTEGGETADDGEAKKPRRRRRGGRGRGGKAKTAAETVAVEEGGAPASAPIPAEPVADTDKVGAAAEAVGEGAGGSRPESEASRPRRGRRRKAVAKDPLAAGETTADGGAEEARPSTKIKKRERNADRPYPPLGAEAPERKQILVSSERNELRVALVEDGRLAEIYIQRPEKKSYLGNIYRAKVENVLGGMDAAFVDFGLEKNGFLYVDEVESEDGESGRGKRITQMLRPGQEILVQVMKDPMGSKGARLTTHLSLAGRYMVYVPGGSGVGVSRRLRQDERDRLRDLCKSLKVRSAGLIVRTAAEGKGVDELRRDMQFLSKLWSRLKAKVDKVSVPGLLHAEVDIALEVTRDLFNESCEALIVDTDKQQKEILTFLDKVAPELSSRVKVHNGETPLFEAYGIEAQISSALERRVLLPSGGNIVIDHTEALTVIDVNSGKFTGGKGLEDTITHTNLEAAREVVRQLRLRDIGGIIIIDFIDMSYSRNREAVLAKLEAELETDRTKTYVVELSPLGLVEMTRQNTTDGARGILTKTCPLCQGKARIMSEETIALGVERKLRLLAGKTAAKACLVEINRAVGERLSADGRLKQLEKEIGKRIFTEGSVNLPIDAFRVLSEGTVAQVDAQRLPVREGEELEIELEHALTHSPQDAVGFVDGYMVIVEGGRPFIGTRRRVKIDTTWRTGAYATAGKGR
jgi:ribonuclease G